MRKFAQSLQYFASRNIGGIACQQDEIGFLQIELAQELQAMRDNLHLVALLFQVSTQVASHARVILYYHHLPGWRQTRTVRAAQIATAWQGTAAGCCQLDG